MKLSIFIYTVFVHESYIMTYIKDYQCYDTLIKQNMSYRCILAH